MSCANTEALKRAGITRDTVSPVDTLKIEKDANGDPTGVFVEREMRPDRGADLVPRKRRAFTHADRLRTLPQSARAYHAFGTTSVFEGHGVATELLRAYKEAHRDGALTMRARSRSARTGRPPAARRSAPSWRRGPVGWASPASATTGSR